MLVKRILDALVAGALLVLASPVIAVLAVLVQRDVGRPVLFRQERPGKDGKIFRLVKLRTMQHGEGDDADRLTPLGRRLRSTSLDELPTLWNVLRGDMSLVGPRPLLPQYLPRYTARQARRHEMRPGITGWAQVNGRNAISWEDRLEADVWYVDHWSMGFDLRILSRTLRAVATRQGISAPGHDTMPLFVGSGPS
jgi:lipopolysaccharide/colanic/teichoic acid biosynthesis glycosyltransferase